MLLRARLRLSANTFAVAALALVLLDLFGFGINFNPFVDPRLAYPETASIRWLQSHLGHDRMTSLATEGRLDWMPHNAPMIFGLRDIHGSDSLRIKQSFDLVSPPDGNQSQYPDPNSPLLNEMSVRYLMTERPLSGKWKLVYDGEAPIYENPGARPRAYSEPLGTFAGEMLPPEFLCDEPDRIVLRASGAGRLILTDPSFPGWRAWIDGKPKGLPWPLDLFAIKGLVPDLWPGEVRCLSLPPGKHTIELRYEPATYRVGLFISLLALCGLLAWGAAFATRRGLARPVSPSE